jgi:outer membrane lipoprotein carrier protein
MRVDTSEGCYHGCAVELMMAVGLTGALLVAAPAPPTPAEALALRVEEKHRTLKDLTATFVQTYRSGMLGRAVVEKGTLSLKPPGRMRWEYRDPEKKTFVSDGRTFYFYVPADRQVIVREQADSRGTPALLLSGRGDILTHFAVTEEEPANGHRRLRLVPKKADPEIDHVILDVDDAARIRGIAVVDAQGNRSQFAFDRFKENVGLADSLFRFQVPRGVEVVSG